MHAMNLKILSLNQQSKTCQGDAVAAETLWSAIVLAQQRQEMFDEDRSRANALVRGRGRKKKESAEARNKILDDALAR
jgi:hypothetical protein